MCWNLHDIHVTPYTLTKKNMTEDRSNKKIQEMLRKTGGHARVNTKC